MQNAFNIEWGDINKELRTNTDLMIWYKQQLLSNISMRAIPLQMDAGRVNVVGSSDH